jgi:hypothetical protein
MTALDFLVLHPECMREERQPAEIAYLAHVLLDETLTSRYTRPRLSPEAHELLELLDDLAATCRLMSLGWTADVEGCSDDAVRLAIRIDRVTASELANVGPFLHVLSALLQEQPSLALEDAA